MSITLLIIKKIRFYLNRSEFEAPHVHVEIDGGGRCKVYLHSMKVRAVRGMKKSQVEKVVKIVEAHRAVFMERWDEEVETE